MSSITSALNGLDPLHEASSVSDQILQTIRTGAIDYEQCNVPSLETQSAQPP